MSRDYVCRHDHACVMFYQARLHRQAHYNYTPALYTNIQSIPHRLKYDLPHINDTPAIVVEKIHTHRLQRFKTYAKHFLIQKYTDTCEIPKHVFMSPMIPS